MKNTSKESIKPFFDNAKTFVVVQADNPDGDSLASALAVGEILEAMGKNVYQFCSIKPADYLSYIDGYDKVSTNLPSQFDASIIVDASATVLFENSIKSGNYKDLSLKPCLVIDHHTNDCDIEFASIIYQKKSVAAGQLVDEVFNLVGAEITLKAKELITIAILSDSLGFMSEATDSTALRLVADYIESGVSLAKIDNLRRETFRKSQRILRYKGELISRIQYWADNQVASIIIPWREIEKYSQEYNPSMLVIDEMRQVNDVKLAVALKIYPDRITAKLRSNYGYRICDKIAESFGGGGHPYASGFKIKGNNLNADEILSKIVTEYYKITNDDQIT